MVMELVNAFSMEREATNLKEEGSSLAAMFASSKLGPAVHDLVDRYPGEGQSFVTTQHPYEDVWYTHLRLQKGQVVNITISK